MRIDLIISPDPGHLDTTRRMLYNQMVYFLALLYLVHFLHLQDMFVLCYSVVDPESFENIEKMVELHSYAVSKCSLSLSLSLSLCVCVCVHHYVHFGSL